MFPSWLCPLQISAYVREECGWRCRQAQKTGNLSVSTQLGDRARFPPLFALPVSLACFCHDRWLRLSFEKWVWLMGSTDCRSSTPLYKHTLSYKCIIPTAQTYKRVHLTTRVYGIIGTCMWKCWGYCRSGNFQKVYSYVDIFTAKKFSPINVIGIIIM